MTKRPVERTSEAVIGGAIRRARTDAGMTQVQLAVALGVTYQQIQNYERGSVRIAASTLMALADMLEVEIWSFFDESTGAD